MDDEATSDQHQNELSIALAASSIINGSDMISQEAYQMNRRRIQEAKEMVRTLEINNENGHKNFVVSQLEKRAKAGREAETMLAQLRNQPGLPEMVRFTNNVPNGGSEVILPTTATLVEVPESSHSSYSSSGATATSPQIPPQGHPVDYQLNNTVQANRAQPYNVFQYYAPPSAVLQPQSSAGPHPADGHTSWYTTQSHPQQFRAHNPPIHNFPPIQQPSRVWSSYATPALSPADTVPVATGYSGYYASPSGLVWTTPVRADPSTSKTTIRPRPPVTAYNQPQSPASASGVQAPLHGAPMSSAKVSYGHPPPARFPAQPAESQPRLLPTAVSKPVSISELQRLRQPLQQPQPQLYQQQQQQQPSSQPQQLQQHSRPSQPQRFPQPLLRSQQERPPEFQSQPVQAHLQATLQSTCHIPSTGVSQSHTQPSQTRDFQSIDASAVIPQTEPPQPAIAQEQVQPRGAQPSVDQTAFVQHFQVALQRGIPQLKVFLLRAKASGISDDWFKAAFNSLPRDVYRSLAAQANQLAPTVNVASSEGTPQDQVLAISGNEPVTTRPLPTATPSVQVTPTPHKPTPTADTSFSAPEQTPESYTTQLQYYAEQATRSMLSAGISGAPAGNITSTKQAASTPTRGVPQTSVNVRTPKDANKSTLARDILRSLGKVAPKHCRETGSERTDNHDGDQLSVNAAPPAFSVAPLKSPAASPGTDSIPTDNSVPSTEPNIQARSPHVASPNQSTKSDLKKECGQVAVIEGPIMIDLTLDDSDESVHGNRQEPTFPFQASTSAATSSLPVSPSATNHTPLLENLSLEEPLVNFAANGDRADVRMYSPPLSPAAEENMESELLYPPTGSAEENSSSFEPLPREEIEHTPPPDGQLPLFLPSPPASPAPTEPPETDLEMTNDEGQSGPSNKRPSVDIDETGVDTTLLMSRVRKRPKLQVYVLVPPAPQDVLRAIKRMKERATGKDIDSDLEGVGEDEEFQYSHLERLLIEESKSRLSERRCRWLNCGAVLNCVANLFAHLKKHACEEDSQALFLCRWASCQRRFDLADDRDEHLERHAIRPLPCPFAGCEEQFDRPVEVMEHEVHHQKAERRGPLVRKSTYEPVVPAIPARLGPPPHQLPSHRVIPRRIVKCRISADRHAIMGPWILWNIFSPVELNTRKQNASMRGRPGCQAVNYDVDNSGPRRDEYDFLLAHSSYPAKHPPPDDLDSTLITMSVARGLTLWGPAGGGSEEGEEDAVEMMLRCSR